jgi:hypothetical protein
MIAKHAPHGARLVLALAISLGALTPLRAAAQTPSILIDDLGVHQITFTTPGVFDFSSHQSFEDGGISFTTEAVQDARGRILGTGRDVGGDFDVKHLIKGKCRSANGVSRLVFRMLSQGSVGSGDPEEYKALGVMRGEVHGWGADAQFVGTLRSRVCLKDEDPILERTKIICRSNTIDHTFSLANAGNWQIRIFIDRIGDRIIGAASITTAVAIASNTRTFDVSVNGKVDSDGVATIDLKPMDASGLGSVRLIGSVIHDPVLDVPTLVAIDEVKGRLLGQGFNEAY